MVAAASGYVVCVRSASMASLRRIIGRTAAFPRFVMDLARFATLSRSEGMDMRLRVRAQLSDRSADAGTLRGAYFHQDLLVAQRIFEAAPKRHIDVGSRIDGFVAHVASFRAIEIVDIRPCDSPIPNIRTMRADMMDSRSVPEGICDSVSCLHALEHFGLGRYGDPIDPRGHEKGLDSLVRMLEPGGTLYLSVPVGPERVFFNCHRRFDARTILRLTDVRLVLRRLDVVDDRGNLRRHVPPEEATRDGALGCRREGCAIFEFTKPRAP